MTERGCPVSVWNKPDTNVTGSRSTRLDLTRRGGLRNPQYATDYLYWSLKLPHSVLWVENVSTQGKVPEWGMHWNAAQFLEHPIQCRNRVVGGRYREPKVFRPYRRHYPDFNICPAITATEFKASGATDKCRASRWYGRNLTIEECAYHQGFEIPKKWYRPRFGLTESQWRQRLYIAIGNGVPVYMARAFGEAYN